MIPEMKHWVREPVAITEVEDFVYKVSTVNYETFRLPTMYFNMHTLQISDNRQFLQTKITDRAHTRDLTFDEILFFNMYYRPKVQTNGNETDES